MTYYTLIGALPALPPHFDVDRLPIARPRLDELLKQLKPDDAVILERLANFITWDRQPAGLRDEDVVEHYERLTRQIRHPVVIELVQQRIDVRTIVAALRRRRRSDEPPIGVGRLVEPIRRGWDKPFFGLEKRFPWVEEFDERMRAGDAIEAERILLDCTWKTFSRMASEFTFSFEAVLLYLVRWSIIERWTTRDLESGWNRYEQLIEETLGEYASISY